MSELVLILSGGKSQRMGQNKALLPFMGQTLIERQIQDILSHKLRPLIASDNEHYPQLKAHTVHYIQDKLPEKQGPLSALLSALIYSQEQKQTGLWVMACDNLLLPSQLFAQLKTHQNTHPAWQKGIVCFQDPPQTYPLIAHWSTHTTHPLTHYLQQGNRRVIPFVHSQIHSLAPLPKQWRTLCHLNTPQEYTQAQKDWKKYENQPPK